MPPADEPLRRRTHRHYSRTPRAEAHTASVTSAVSFYLSLGTILNTEHEVEWKSPLKSSVESFYRTGEMPDI